MTPFALSRPDGTISAYECSVCGEVYSDHTYPGRPAGSALAAAERCHVCVCDGVPGMACHPTGSPCGAQARGRRGTFCEACQTRYDRVSEETLKGSDYAAAAHVLMDETRREMGLSTDKAQRSS